MRDVSTAALRARRKAGYEGARPDVLAHVPAQASRILELGCSAGALGASIKARQSAHVLGVEYDEAYASTARQRLDEVVVGDAGEFVRQRPSEAPFDCVICADVLEHLVDPWSVFNAVCSWLTPGGTAIVSLPNVMHYRGLIRIARDRRWPRDPEGVFDATHLRWFGLGDVEDLFAGAGLVIDDVEHRFWEEHRPRRDRTLRLLARTPVHPVLAKQYVVTGHRPAS